MLVWRGVDKERHLQEALRTRGRYHIGKGEDKNANTAMDVPAEEDHEEELMEAWDDIDSQELDLKHRVLEMEWHRKMTVYEKRPIEECFEKTKRPPIKVKWVDHNTGDSHNVNVRLRLVAKHINTGKEEGFFAATPPLEALRMLLSATFTGNKPKTLMFNDTIRAYTHARTARSIGTGSSQSRCR